MLAKLEWLSSIIILPTHLVSVYYYIQDALGILEPILDSPESL